MGRHPRLRLHGAGVLVLAVVLAVVLAGAAACGNGTRPPAGLGVRGPATSSTTATPASTSAPAAGREGVPAFGHVFVVVMENLGAPGALAVPQIAALTARYQWTTNWYAVAHPSLPNYLGLVSGSTWGVSSDCTSCIQRGPTLASQLDAAGISWGAYFGGMPSACFLGPESPDGSYAQKHDPFAYFADLRSSAAACGHLEPLGALGPLLGGPASAVPRFVWVTPTMCDSGHDCSPATAGAWLRALVGQVTTSAAWRSGGLLVVTWDEGDKDSGVDPATGALGSAGGGAVLTVVATPGGPAGRRLSGPFSHYSLLRTLEDAFGLPLLGAAGDPGVRAMGAFFDGGGA